MTKVIKLFAWNVNGAATKLDKLVSFLQDFDILVISELKHAYTFEIPGFNTIRSAVIGGEEHRGGLALCFKHWLSKYVSQITRCRDQVWIKCALLKNAWIGGCYVPPRDSPFFKTESFARIQEFCINNKAIIVGDLNARIPNLNTFNSDGVWYSENPDRGSNANGNEVMSICRDFKLTPVNHMNSSHASCKGNFTYRQGERWVSQLDWALIPTNMTDSVMSMDIPSGGFRQSNHAPLILALKPSVDHNALRERACNLGRYEYTGVRSSHRSRRPLKFHQIDRDSFFGQLPNLTERYVRETLSNPSTLAQVLYDSCNNAMLPRTRNPNHPNAAEDSRWSRVLQMNDPKELWKAIGWKGSFSESLEQPRPPDEEFGQHFSALLGPARDPLVPPTTHLYIPVLDDDITPLEVHQAVCRIKTTKAPGTDGIPPGILKALPDEWMGFIAEIFSAVFSSGEYPEDWTLAKLFVIYKKGDALLPTNYRGISILCALAKVYDSILSRRLSQWFRPGVEQAGAQKNRGCNEQILVLRTLIEFARSKRKTLYVTFIDFRQAYDRVPRQKLISLLAEKGCGQRMLNAVTASLQGTKSLLNSLVIDATVGVRQGGPSSCFFFTMFVDPLVRMLRNLEPDGYLNRMHTLLLMDDTVLFASSRERMVEKLEVLAEYCREYGMNKRGKDKVHWHKYC